MSFKINDYVRLIKIGSVDEPYSPTPSWDAYDMGKDNIGYSLPANYIAEGFIHWELEVGKALLIDRTVRNGVTAAGALRTSQVKKILEEDNYTIIFETENSRYKMQKVIEPLKSESGETEWSPE